MEAIGHRIRALRKVRKLTQVELAKLLGIDQSTLSDIERGAKFSAGILIGLADHLHTSPHYIMCKADEDQFDEAELLATYRSLDDTKRDTLRQVLKGLAATSDPSPALPYKRKTISGQ